MGTHAEQDYVLKGQSFFDALVLNANLVEGTKATLGILITRLQKPYFIDPVTYAFGLDPRLLLSSGAKGEAAAKRSFVSLAGSYGLIPERVGVRPVRPSDLDGEAVVDFTERVLEYQRTTLAQALSDDAAFVMSDIADRASLLTPQAAIAPYFVDDLRSTWRNVNTRMLNAAASRGLPFDGAIAVDSRGVTSQYVAELAVSYSEIGAETVFLWLTDLDEHAAPTTLLRAYANLVSLLSSQGKRVIASYGGFFSVLLAFKGLAGSSHGIGYGDKRDLEPVVGGGLPPARYYLPPLRDSIGLGDIPLIAAGLTTAQFRDRVCACTICRGLLDSGGVEGLVDSFTETEDRRTTTGRVVAVPTARVYRMSRFHFMEARGSEYDLIRQIGTLDELATLLRNDANWVQERLGWSSVAHIDRWIDAVSEIERPEP